MLGLNGLLNHSQRNSEDMPRRYFTFLLPVILWGVALSSVAQSSVQKTIGKTVVTVTTDRPGAVYTRNVPIYFNIHVLVDGAPARGRVSYVISDDGMGALKTGDLDLKEDTPHVQWKQSTPMIVRCTVTYTTADGKQLSGMAAAAVAPYEIKPTETAPDDLMHYWDKEKANLAGVPINARLTSIESQTPGVTIYDITLDNVQGAHVHGYFGKPEGNGPFPALLYIPGAGVGSASADYAQSMAAKGFLVMAISVHDLPNGKPAQFYEKQYAGPLKNYYLQGRENRDSFYFHRVVLGCVRAIDYLTSRPEWDHQHMIVNGSSQGGGLTLITTGLDPRVTAAAANVPALSDHSGRNFDRPSGWPQLAPLGADGKLDPKILQVARYYDAVNFARRIRVPMIFGVGLIDNTCHPTTVFSAYNVVQGPKEIDIAPLMGHAFDPAYNKMLSKFILQQGGKNK